MTRPGDATTRIDLLRHGEPQGGELFRGTTDHPLSEQGWRQMWSAIGEDDAWETIYSSPLCRCLDFARDLAGRNHQQLRIDDDLREISFGEWEGLSAAEVERRFPGQLRRYWSSTGFTPEGAEPVTGFQQRVAASFDSMIDSHRGQRILVVCHGGVIRAALAHLLDLPLASTFGIAVHFAARALIEVHHGEAGRRGQLVNLGQHQRRDA